MLEISILTAVVYTRPASLLERAVMLEISILTAVAITRPASLLERAVMLEISILCSNETASLLISRC